MRINTGCLSGRSVTDLPDKQPVLICLLLSKGPMAGALNVRTQTWGISLVDRVLRVGYQFDWWTSTKVGCYSGSRRLHLAVPCLRW